MRHEIHLVIAHLCAGLDGDSQVRELHGLVARLPPDNYAVLNYLISFLAEVRLSCVCTLLNVNLTLGL